MSKNACSVNLVAPGVAKLACDLVQEEQNALYALANAALKNLEPPEGTDPIEFDNFFAYMLVRLMHERLESTELQINLLDILQVQPADTEPVLAGAGGEKRRAVQ